MTKVERTSTNSGDEKPLKVLVVDDDRSVRISLECVLREFEVFPAARLSEAWLILQDHPDISAVVSDFDLPDGNGLELFAWLRNRYPMLLISGRFRPHQAQAGLRFLAKPFSNQELLAEVLGLIASAWTMRSSLRSAVAIQSP